MERLESEKFTNSSCVLPTSCVVYQLIEYRNLWSIAYVTFNVKFQKVSIFKRKHDTKMEFLEGWGVFNFKSLLWEGYGYFLEQHNLYLHTLHTYIHTHSDQKGSLFIK